MSPTTSLDVASVHRLVGRYHNQGIPIWMIDPRDALTDIRALSGGTVIHLGRDDSRVNLLQPCVLGPEQSDAAELAEILLLLAGQDGEQVAEHVQGPIHEFLLARSEQGVFRGATLPELLSDLERYSGEFNPLADLLTTLKARLEAEEAVSRVMGEPTKLKKGSVKQFSYTPVTALMHRAVTLTINRLARVATRQHNSTVVLVTLSSPHDTPRLAAQVWENKSSNRVLYIRG